MMLFAGKCDGLSTLFKCHFVLEKKEIFFFIISVWTLSNYQILQNVRFLQRRGIYLHYLWLQIVPNSMEVCFVLVQILSLLTSYFSAMNDLLQVHVWFMVLIVSRMCRFRNELPDPVSQPKLMHINNDKDQCVPLLLCGFWSGSELLCWMSLGPVCSGNGWKETCLSQVILQHLECSCQVTTWSNRITECSNVLWRFRSSKSRGDQDWTESYRYGLNEYLWLLGDDSLIAHSAYSLESLFWVQVY